MSIIVKGLAGRPEITDPSRLPVNSAALSLFYGDSNGVGQTEDHVAAGVQFPYPASLSAPSLSPAGNTYGCFIWNKWSPTDRGARYDLSDGTAFAPVTNSLGEVLPGTPSTGPYTGPEYGYAATRFDGLQNVTDDNRGCLLTVAKFARSGATIGDFGVGASTLSPAQTDLVLGNPTADDNARSCFRMFAEKNVGPAIASLEGTFAKRVFIDALYMSAGGNDAGNIAVADDLYGVVDSNLLAIQEATADYLGLPTIPIVITLPPLVGNDNPATTGRSIERARVVRERLTDLANKVPNIYVVNTDRFRRLADDPIHYTALSQVKIGEAMADVWRNNTQTFQEVDVPA